MPSLSISGNSIITLELAILRRLSTYATSFGFSPRLMSTANFGMYFSHYHSHVFKETLRGENKGLTLQAKFGKKHSEILRKLQVAYEDKFMSKICLFEWAR